MKKEVKEEIKTWFKDHAVPLIMVVIMFTSVTIISVYNIHF